MLGTSPQGLTTRDFHGPQAFIDPRDIFPIKNRQPARNAHKPRPGNQARLSFPAPSTELSQYTCCGEADKPGCIKLNEDDPGSPDTCEGDCDQCEDCFQDHQACDEDEIKCVDNCDECSDEHDAACGQHGQVCTEECTDCQFSCFDCIDWNAFENDKSLGLSYSVPLLSQDGFNLDAEIDTSPTGAAMDLDTSCWQDMSIPPLDMSMHHYCLTGATPYWDPTIQAQICPPDVACIPSTLDQSQLHFSPSLYRCHPAAAHQRISQQQPLPAYDLHSTLSNAPSAVPASLPENNPVVFTTNSSSTSSGRVCQWLMPCGTMCGATFASTADLKKHLKAVHTVKGTIKCCWQGCSAAFASEAALTGHISKKHLSASSTDEDGPFKCTFAGCTKSFMYKQVRDEHIASCHDGNKMYCDICKQWLNAEGSNFKRHMASHQPKHQHMICKFHHLGCKRRFPRLDNLRRHEACCKFGKKAALHHHHHHRHVAH